MRTAVTTRADALLARLSSEQHGVFTLAQASAAGLTNTALSRRVTAGRLILDLPGVFAHPATPWTWEREAIGAIFYAGEGSCLSFAAAARLHELDGFEDAPVEVSSTRRKRGHGMSFVIHRCDEHLLEDITCQNAIRVTSLRRTLLDLSGCRHRRHEQALDQALRERRTDLGEMWTLYEVSWTRGRRGIAIMRELLRERTPGDAPTQSELADLLTRIIHRFGLPRGVEEFPIDLGGQRIHVDLAYPKHRVAIECDGYAYHSDRRSFERDRIRDNRLQALGWIVLRYTWARLRWQPDEVASEIREHLEARSPSMPSGRQIAL